MAIHSLERRTAAIGLATTLVATICGCRPNLLLGRPRQIEYIGVQEAMPPPSKPDAPYVPSEWRVSWQFPLSCLLPATRIDVISKRDDSRQAARLTAPGQSFLICSLKQLQGHVRVRDAAAALNFVRFGTYNLHTYWDSNVFEIHPGDKSSLNSGGNGVLSPRAFQLGRFQPATVEPARGGYRITRWIWNNCYDGGSTIEKWQETVLADGTYQLSVIDSRPTPNLPQTKWRMVNEAYS